MQKNFKTNAKGKKLADLVLEVRLNFFCILPLGLLLLLEEFATVMYLKII